MPDPLVLLHGFAGTGRSWDAVRDHLDAAGEAAHAPDLRGHGERSHVRPVTFDGCVEDVLAQAPERFVLAGYSMGGRIALHLALAAPRRVAHLVLVSTTAGIEDDAERARRREADAQLAARCERDGIEAFAGEWQVQPLFAGTPPDAAERWRDDLLRNTPEGLAAALRGIGTGSMTPLWDRLGELTMPATVLAGERDAKFRDLGERLAAALPRGRLVVVAGAGHGLPREAPAAVAGALAQESA